MAIFPVYNADFGSERRFINNKQDLCLTGVFTVSMSGAAVAQLLPAPAWS